MKRALLRDEIWRDVLVVSPPKVEGHRTMSQFEIFLQRATDSDRKTIKLFFSGLETRIADLTRGLITIPHWGSLGIKIKPRKGRIGRNPATGETNRIPPKQIAKGYLLFAISAKDLRAPNGFHGDAPSPVVQ